MPSANAPKSTPMFAACSRRGPATVLSTAPRPPRRAVRPPRHQRRPRHRRHPHRARATADRASAPGSWPRHVRRRERGHPATTTADARPARVPVACGLRRAIAAQESGARTPRGGSARRAADPPSAAGSRSGRWPHDPHRSWPARPERLRAPAVCRGRRQTVRSSWSGAARWARRAGVRVGRRRTVLTRLPLRVSLPSNGVDGATEHAAPIRRPGPVLRACSVSRVTVARRTGVLLERLGCHADQSGELSHGWSLSWCGPPRIHHVRTTAGSLGSPRCGCQGLLHPHGPAGRSTISCS